MSDVSSGFRTHFLFWPETMWNASINDRVSKVAASATSRNGVQFVQLEVVGSKRNPTLRIYIDRPEGVTLDDCSAVSAAIEAELDADDFIPYSYTLEVSSPGLERALYSLSDFKRFAGHRAKVSLLVEKDGRKSYSGRIVGVEGDEIILEDRTVGTVRFPFSTIAKANLRVDLEDEFRRRR